MSQAPKIIPVCYLLHFDEKISHVQHYLGRTTNIRLQVRMMEHQAGLGSRLTAELYHRGIGFSLVKVWQYADAERERQLKIRSHFSRHCPYCNDIEHDHHGITHYAPVEGTATVLAPKPLDWSHVV